jgi:hypothetical protein
MLTAPFALVRRLRGDGVDEDSSRVIVREVE